MSGTQGDTDHDSPDLGAPVKIGGTATAVAPASSVGEGDRVNANFDLRGRQRTATTNADVISTNNSTTTPLLADAVYTGTGDDCIGYAAVTTTLFSSHDSATDGMTFQFSMDNTNWDDVYSFSMDVSASNTRRFQFPVTARYYRVVYTNGGTGQSAFRVQTILHGANQLTSVHRLGDSMTGDRSAQVVKTVLFGERSTGNFDAVLVDTSGALVALDSDHYHIHEGNAFETNAVDLNLGSAATLILAFKTPPVTKMHFRIRYGSLTVAHVDLQEDATWTAETGSLAPIYNRNRAGTPGSSAVLENQSTAGFTATDNVVLNPTGFSAGTAVNTLYAFAARTSAGEGGSESIWILEEDTQYAVVLTSDAANNKAQLTLTWYENGI